MNKNNLFFLVSVVALVLLTNCNMSDYMKDLPGGYIYIHEGGCANNLLSNSKKVPDIIIGILDLKYNKRFINVSRVDSSLCYENSYKESDKQFYIIDIRNDTAYGPMVKKNFDSLAKKFHFSEDLLFNY